MKQSTCQYCKKAISKQNMRKHQKTQTCKKFQVPVLSDFDKEIMRLCEEREREFNSDYESDGEYSDSDIEDEYAVVFGYDMLDTGGILQLKAKIREPQPQEERSEALCSCGEPLEDEDYDECRFCDQQRCDNEYEDGEIDEDGNPTNPEEELLKRERKNIPICRYCGKPFEDEDYDELCGNVCFFCEQQGEVLLEDKRLLHLKETNQIPSRNWKEGLVLMSRYDPEDENVSYTNDELELMGGYASDSSHESYHGDGIFSHFSKTTQLHSNFHREYD